MERNVAGLADRCSLSKEQPIGDRRLLNKASTYATRAYVDRVKKSVARTTSALQRELNTTRYSISSLQSEVIVLRDYVNSTFTH